MGLREENHAQVKGGMESGINAGLTGIRARIEKPLIDKRIGCKEAITMKHEA